MALTTQKLDELCQFLVKLVRKKGKNINHTTEDRPIDFVDSRKKYELQILNFTVRLIISQCSYHSDASDQEWECFDLQIVAPKRKGCFLRKEGEHRTDRFGPQGIYNEMFLGREIRGPEPWHISDGTIPKELISHLKSFRFSKKTNQEGA